MEVKIKGIALTDGDVVFSAEVLATAKEFENTKSNYSYRPLAEMVRDKIALAIADEYLKANKATIMQGINAEDLINGVKLKIVEGFSLNRT